jgi:hypothetical protein
MSKHQGERFEVVLQAQADAVPALPRLRRALKVLLRGFGLRAVSCRRLQPPQGTPAVPQGDGKPDAGANEIAAPEQPWRTQRACGGR